MPPKTHDAYYTPSWLADDVAAALPADFAGSVLDPAAGEGALLAAVDRRFGDSTKAFAIDIDPYAAASLKLSHPSWVVSRADFLSSRSRSASRVWREVQAGLGAVVLNPPYSYRGNAGRRVSFGTFVGRVAPAMHFLIEALVNLQPRYGFVAILPSGALDAERHTALWAQIRRLYSVDHIQTPGTSSFRGARVATSVVRLQAASTEVATATAVPSVMLAQKPVAGCNCVEIVRGRVPVHRFGELGAGDESVPFVHTTSLVEKADRTTRLGPAVLSDEGPFYLMVRVGRWIDPRPMDVGRVVLSDCVIGLRPRDKSAMSDFGDSLERLGPQLRTCYGGTGAPYITLTKLATVLRDNGWHPHVVRAGSARGSCCCRPDQTGCAEIA